MSDVITRLRSFDRKLDRKLFYISNIIRSIILWIFYIFFRVTSILCNFTSLNFPKSAVITIALFVSQKFVDQFGQHFTRIDCKSKIQMSRSYSQREFPYQTVKNSTLERKFSLHQPPKYSSSSSNRFNSLEHGKNFVEQQPSMKTSEFHRRGDSESPFASCNV